MQNIADDSDKSRTNQEADDDTSICPVGFSMNDNKSSVIMEKSEEEGCWTCGESVCSICGESV